MNKSTTPPRKNSWYYDHHKAKRFGRQAKFIKELFADGFTVQEIKKVFYKMPTAHIIAIVRS